MGLWFMLQLMAEIWENARNQWSVTRNMAWWVWNLLYWTRESTGTRKSKGGESMSPKCWTRSSTNAQPGSLFLSYHTTINFRLGSSWVIEWLEKSSSFLLMQLDVDVSPPTNIIAFGLTLRQIMGKLKYPTLGHQICMNRVGLSIAYTVDLTVWAGNCA